MRKQHRLRALRLTKFCGVLTLSAGLLAANPLLGTPVQAWSSRDEAPTPDNWEALRWCESTNDYTAATGNGYYGAYQFSAQTWWWLGYEGLPNQAKPEVQDQAAMDLYNYANWDSWPSCARWLGLKYSSR